MSLSARVCDCGSDRVLRRRDARRLAERKREAAAREIQCIIQCGSGRLRSLFMDEGPTQKEGVFKEMYAASRKIVKLSNCRALRLAVQRSVQMWTRLGRFKQWFNCHTA